MVKGDNVIMIVYYAKFNINSNVEEIKKDNKKLESILEDLGHQIDVNSKKYEYIHVNEYYIKLEEVDEEGNEIKRKISEKEVYRFINTKKLEEKHGDVIVGELMREKPDSIDIYDKKTHKIKSSGINERVFSTLFIFDLRSETIAFTERKGIGRKQFINAFEELSKDILKGKAIKVYLKQDPRSFVDKVQELTRVNEIDVEVISPNFVDEELDELEKEAKRIGEEMDEQNITKMQHNLETSVENDEGIDLKGKFAKDVLEKYSVMSILGYAKSKISGFIGKEAKIIKSEEDAPFMTNINYNERDNQTSFKEHVLRGIKQEAGRRAVMNEINKEQKQNKDELNE